MLFSSHTTLQVISCSKCSQRPKKCCCLVNAEYWLICGGGEGVKGSWVSIKTFAIPATDATSGHPSASRCDSSNYHSNRTELYFWEIGHLLRASTSKAAVKHGSKQPPHPLFLHLLWSQIKFTLSCLQKYTPLTVYKSRNENTLYLKHDKEWVSISFFFFNKWWVISSSERSAGGSLIHGLNYECSLYNRMCNYDAEYWFPRFGCSFKNKGHIERCLIKVNSYLSLSIFLWLWVWFINQLKHNFAWSICMLFNCSKDLCCELSDWASSSFLLDGGSPCSLSSFVSPVHKCLSCAAPGK